MVVAKKKPKPSSSASAFPWRELASGSVCLLDDCEITPASYSQNKASGSHPIERWKRDVPKMWAGLQELDSHLCWFHRILLGEDDLAFPLFLSERVSQPDVTW
jgi:hypothetical protein